MSLAYQMCTISILQMDDHSFDLSISFWSNNSNASDFPWKSETQTNDSHLFACLSRINDQLQYNNKRNLKKFSFLSYNSSSCETKEVYYKCAISTNFYQSLFIP